ncbi:MAG: beta-mannosidase [Bacteroidales bacterium]
MKARNSLCNSVQICGVPSRRVKPTFGIIALLLILFACGKKQATKSDTAAGSELASEFITQKDGQFLLGGKPYYYIGTNYWYGPILGSTGNGGNRERLGKELDFMKENGIVNLRVLVGADGVEGQEVKIRPTLQIAPGVYNDTLFDGLDYFMAEISKRGMHAVLFLNNSWEWSGGYGQYLEWAGKGKVPEKGVHDWPVFVEHVAKYADCDSCHALFFNHVRHVLSRTNRYTGKKYIDDEAIMAWQVGNEPRAFSNEAKPAYAKWIRETTALIRSLDKNHLISIGHEGEMGAENDISLYEQIHDDPNVDYFTFHIWPKNWSWIDSKDIVGSVDKAIERTKEYFAQHISLAKRYNEPIVLEEFGFPRDNHKYTLDDPVSARDRYYSFIFSQVVESYKTQGNLAGCNFWAMGGLGRPAHVNWQAWDDYVGDPSQEEQGLNSVFDTDSTIKIIKENAELIEN